jgi:negative regulator of genetic competence, sporulation and motility
LFTSIIWTFRPGKKKLTETDSWRSSKKYQPEVEMAGKAKKRRMQREEAERAELSAAVMTQLRERVRRKKLEQEKTTAVVSYEEFTELVEASKAAKVEKEVSDAFGI